MPLLLKMFQFKKDLITSKQIKYIVVILTNFTLFYMWENCAICGLCMFFNSDKQLSFHFSNVLGIQVTWILQLINDATPVKFINPIFQWEINLFRRLFNIVQTVSNGFVIFLLNFDLDKYDQQFWYQSEWFTFLQNFATNK